MPIIDDEITKAQTYKAPETKPITTEVDAETETVEGRMNKMNETGSTYTNLNRQDAKRSSNDRGLINSTMAGTAGVEAGIRASKEIAALDAPTYTQTRFNNQSDENDFLKNRQSADLNKETATHANELRSGELKTANDLAMERDTHSSNLNQSMAAFESTLKQSEMVLDSDLRLAFEEKLQSDKFSDEAKMSIVDTMNNIVRDTQAQITTIGTSDRTAAQQATAIRAAEVNRDAQLAVYEDLLGSMEGWDWGTDFGGGGGASSGGNVQSSADIYQAGADAAAATAAASTSSQTNSVSQGLIDRYGEGWQK
jgi:hypothetical protein